MAGPPSGRAGRGTILEVMLYPSLGYLAPHSSTRWPEQHNLPKSWLGGHLLLDMIIPPAENEEGYTGFSRRIFWYGLKA